MQRDAINEILRYASKNRLPEGLKEQMLAHMQLKFKTAELQQEEVIEDLPKAIRSSIAQHLFYKTIENTYLFKDVSEDFIRLMVKHSSFHFLKTCYHHLLVNFNISNKRSKIPGSRSSSGCVPRCMEHLCLTWRDGFNTQINRSSACTLSAQANFNRKIIE